MATEWLLLMVVVLSSHSVHSQTSSYNCDDDASLLSRLERGVEMLLTTQQRILDRIGKLPFHHISVL